MGDFSQGLSAGVYAARAREDIRDTRRKRAQEDAIGASQADFIDSLAGAIPPQQSGADPAAPANGALPSATAPAAAASGGGATAYPDASAQAIPAGPAQSVPPQMATPGQPAQQPAGWHNPAGFGQFHVSKVPPTLQGDIDDVATHLHDHALDSNGEPNNAKGIAVSPQSVLAQTANDPNAAQGIPEESAAQSKKPHSLTTDFWDESDQKILKAARTAAANGHDPAQVMDNLQKVRIGFVQSHIMRNLSAANVAVMNGDDKAVEKALRNVNYYLPDGADLNIKKMNGQLVYQSPLTPYLDADGNPTDAPGGKENFIPVDAAHLQMLGTAVLDPMKVNDLIVNARAAAVKAKLDIAKAQNETVTADAAMNNSKASVLKAQTERQRMASGIYKDTSQGTLNEAHARYYDNWIDMKIKGASTDANARTAGDNAAKAVYALAQGQPTTAPLTDSAGNPSLSPAAGKSYRDPGKALPEFKGMAPEQVHNIAALAGEIGAANPRMSAEQAAQVATRVSLDVKKTHPGANGPEGNVKIAQDRTHGWYWNGTSWTPFNIAAQTGGVLASGQTTVIPAPSADQEEGELSGEENPSADDLAPAE